MNDTGTSNEGHFEVVSNADNSGNFLYKTGEAKYAEIFWNSDGSGTYMVLDGSDEVT